MGELFGSKSGPFPCCRLLGCIFPLRLLCEPQTLDTDEAKESLPMQAKSPRHPTCQGLERSRSRIENAGNAKLANV